MATHASLPVATLSPTHCRPVLPAAQGWRLGAAEAKPRSGCRPRVEGGEEKPPSSNSAEAARCTGCASRRWPSTSRTPAAPRCMPEQ
eukprot:2095729-Pleurochrysis_carterae.AAC.1